MVIILYGKNKPTFWQKIVALDNRIVSQRFLFYCACNVERLRECCTVYFVPYLSLFLT